MAHKLELEIELKSCADKYWSGLKEFATIFPKVVPDFYESVEVLEGDGKSAGSIFLSTFKPEIKSVISTTKERVEFVDEGRRTLSYSLLEGEILKSYKSFKATVSVIHDGPAVVVKYSKFTRQVNKSLIEISSRVSSPRFTRIWIPIFSKIHNHQ